MILEYDAYRIYALKCRLRKNRGFVQNVFRYTLSTKAGFDKNMRQTHKS